MSNSNDMGTCESCKKWATERKACKCMSCYEKELYVIREVARALRDKGEISDYARIIEETNKKYKEAGRGNRITLEQMNQYEKDGCFDLTLLEKEEKRKHLYDNLRALNNEMINQKRESIKLVDDNKNSAYHSTRR